jgi:cold shock CspA family protein
MSDGREWGTVKFFNRAKMFGFITPDHGEVEIYLSLYEVEAAELPHDPRQGDRISYIARRMSKGDAATQVEFEKL